MFIITLPIIESMLPKNAKNNFENIGLWIKTAKKHKVVYSNVHTCNM